MEPKEPDSPVVASEAIDWSAVLTAVTAGGLGIVDVRSAGEYAAAHLRGSSNFPYSELAVRTAELPPQTGEPIHLVAADSAELTNALSFLRGDGKAANAVGSAGKARGWAVREVMPGTAALWAAATQLGLVEQGAVSRRLWSPSSHLPRLVPLLEEVLPPAARRALDLGCGRGRDCIWLAARGWEVVGVDNQASFLRSLADFAARQQLVGVRPLMRDVRREGVADLFAPSLLAPPLALVNVSRFMSRVLLDAVVEQMPAGCVLAVHHFALEVTIGKGRTEARANITEARVEGERRWRVHPSPTLRLGCGSRGRPHPRRRTDLDLDLGRCFVACTLAPYRRAAATVTLPLP